jgi:choice-of-anchor A domain-containing protein
MRIALLIIMLSSISFGANSSLIEMNMNLKSADDYVLATGGYGSLIIGSSANIDGNIASQYYIGLSSSTNVNGNACAPYIGKGASVSISGETGRCEGLRKLGRDIQKASRKASYMASHYLGYIDNDKEINIDGNEVYSLSDLTLQSGETFKISGSSNSAVIINIFGDAILGSGSNIILSGGITSANVLFNFVGHYASFNVGAAKISGTYLSDNTSFIIGDGATLDDTRFLTNGSIIANIQDISYGKHTDIDGIDGGGNDITVGVPEANMIILFLLGGLFMANRKRLNNDK